MAQGERDLQPLSDQERAALAQSIADVELANAPAVDQPRALLTGGQPGSGKTVLVDELASQFPDGVVVVDPDEIRPQLPYMEDRMARGELAIPPAADVDAGAIAYQVVQAAIEGKRNVLVDGTLKNTDNALSLATQLRGAGYTVELHGMAVYPDLSHARTYGRREAEIATSVSGFGRGVDDAYHHAAVHGYAVTVATVYETHSVDVLALYSHEGQPLVELTLTDGQWTPPGVSPIDVLQGAHDRPAEASKVEAADTWTLATAAIKQRHGELRELVPVEWLREAAMARLTPVLAEANATYEGPILSIDHGPQHHILQAVNGRAIAHDRGYLMNPPTLEPGDEVKIAYLGRIASVTKANDHNQGRGR
jgi:predicted kinase